MVVPILRISFNDDSLDDERRQLGLVVREISMMIGVSDIDVLRVSFDGRCSLKKLYLIFLKKQTRLVLI